jgi:hypothetical protein
MSGIESPLGKVTYSSGPKKVLTVEDQTSNQPTSRSFSASNDVSDEEFESRFTKEELEDIAREELRSARKERISQRNKIPEGVKKRLEILAGIGRLIEDVVVDGITFSIRSLKPKEVQEVAEEMLKKNTQVECAFINRDQTLARAIYKIDGQNIEDVIGDKTIQGKVDFVQNVLEESLVNFLYNKYQNILSENKKKFEDLGKTREEVVENVKKS